LLTWSLSHDPRTSREKNDRFAAAGGWVAETVGAKKNDLFGADWVADHERMGDHGEIR
jgi:hypothetical protein